MSQVWYDLPPLQAVGLAAMRLVQMEQTLERLLQDAVDRARKRSAPVSILVPDFDAADLGIGWKRRVRTIVDKLRDVVLRDDDYHSVRNARYAANDDNDLWRGAPNGDSYIDGVEAFFISAGRYPPISGRRAWVERRKTVDLLDIALSRRFRDCGDSQEGSDVIHALDGSLCFDRCPMGEDGTALSGEADRPWA